MKKERKLHLKIKDLGEMNWLNNALILEAIDRYTQEIIDVTTPEYLKEMEEKRPIICPKLWLKMAKENRKVILNK